MRDKAIDKPRDPRAINSLTHGLTGRIYHLTAEDEAAYEAHVRGYRQSFAPSGPVETDLVQAIADDRWRLKRAATIESAIFVLDRGIDPAPQAVAETWLRKGANLALISLYETRIQRRAERNMQQLRQLQAERKAIESQFIEEAARLAELAESKGEVYDPAEDFAARNYPANFAFSAQNLIRHRRLAEAQRNPTAIQKPMKMAA